MQTEMEMMEMIKYSFQKLLQGQKDLVMTVRKLCKEELMLTKDLNKDLRETPQAVIDERREGGEVRSQGCELESITFKIEVVREVRKAGAQNQGNEATRFKQTPRRIRNYIQNNFLFSKKLYLKGETFRWMLAEVSMVSGEGGRSKINKSGKGQTFSGHRINPPGKESQGCWEVG